MKLLHTITHSYIHTFIQSRVWLYGCMGVWKYGCIVVCFLFISTAAAQENNHVFVERGSTTTLTWKAAGDYSAYDSLYFVVKPCTSNTCARLIQKPTGVTYSAPYTTMTCTLYVDETASFNAARYYYSIYAYGPDTVWVTSGNFNLMLNGQTPTDGVPSTSPYYTIALSPPVHDPAFIIGDSSADSWSQIDSDSMRALLNLDTNSVDANFDSLYNLVDSVKAEWGGQITPPDSIIYTSELADTAQALRDADADFVTKSTPQDIIAQKNFMGMVKFNSDTSMIAGTTDDGIPLFLKWDLAKNYSTYYSIANLFTVSPSGSDSVSDWTMQFRTWNYLGVMGHGMYFGLNQNYRRLNEPIFSFVSEAPYRALDSVEIYEWYWAWANKINSPDYSYRPFGLAVYYYRDPITNLPLNTSPGIQLTPALSEITFLDKDRNYIMQMLFDGSGYSNWAIDDTFNISYHVNNGNWLYQTKSDGVTGKEIIRVDDDDDVVVSPDGSDHIKLKSPINGQVKWNKTQSSGTIPIEPDTSNDKLNIGSNEGLFTQQLSVGYFYTDTTGRLSGEIIANPNSGVLSYLFPLDIVVNGDFTDWTGDDPDGWTVQSEDAGNYVEESPTGQLHFVTDGLLGPSVRWGLSQDVLMLGVTYGYSFEVTVATSDTVVVAFDGVNLNISTVGIFIGEFTATGSTQILIRENFGAANITFDNFKVWVKNGAAKQPTYIIHAPQRPDQILNPTVDDTVSNFYTHSAIIIDSIQVRTDDSITVVGTFGALGLGTTCFNAYTNVSGWNSITTFNDATIPAGNEVYFYFTYIGDALTYFRYKIYWRE